ncbi:sensor histidine kinase [Saccharopolyspora shandongensis]|uniref:sensor histidine kinase n=1 Tax=Saccharopolyspora shandongensis TaxID=418495 RepID=UPI0033EFEE12
MLIALIIESIVVLTLAALLIARILAGRRRFGTTAEMATFDTLHTAWSAAPPLRAGLVPAAARKSARHLRALLGTPALAITDETELLAWDGDGQTCHGSNVVALGAATFAGGRAQVITGREQLGCTTADCPVRGAVIAPLIVDDRVVGAITTFTPEASTGLVRAAGEVARWASGQLELAELDRSKRRLLEAEVRALRAQISPHFIYNSLTVIAAFVRTDPTRARQLLLDFADFTRYSFRRHGDFTTLAEELRSINQYLTLQRARFGERFEVSLEIAPEVLPVAVPFLCLQPLVENAIRHGMEGKAGNWHLTIVAEDVGSDAHITIEDDGIGMDPEKLRRTLAGDVDPSAGIGLGNIDERLRQVFGDEYGLVVETALGAGTKVRVRVPKYRAGVQAS